MNAPPKPASTRQFSTDGDYKVADISLADWGRKEIDIAEPGRPGRRSQRPSAGGSGLAYLSFAALRSSSALSVCSHENAVATCCLPALSV